MAIAYIPFQPLTAEEQADVDAYLEGLDEEEALFNLFLYFLKEFAT